MERCLAAASRIRSGSVETRPRAIFRRKRDSRAGDDEKEDEPRGEEGRGKVGTRRRVGRLEPKRRESEQTEERTGRGEQPGE